MMENQHRKISGYRELTQEEIDLMNEIKAMGPALDALLVRVLTHIGVQQERSRLSTITMDDERAAETAALRDRLAAAQPARWAAEARTDLQKGLMSLTRAVAQPTFF